MPNCLFHHNITSPKAKVVIKDILTLNNWVISSGHLPTSQQPLGKRPPPRHRSRTTALCACDGFWHKDEQEGGYVWHTEQSPGRPMWESLLHCKQHVSLANTVRSSRTWKEASLKHQCFSTIKIQFSSKEDSVLKCIYYKTQHKYKVTSAKFYCL